MSDFKAKMHQIRFPLGLRPRPRWELTDPSCNLRSLLLMGGKGRRGKGKGKEREKEKERGVKRRGRGK